MKVNGTTNSFLGSDLLEGQASETRPVYLHKDCDNVNNFSEISNIITQRTDVDGPIHIVKFIQNIV